MISSALRYFIYRFCSVKRAPAPYGLAPHKPILLLTILQVIEEQRVENNRITLDQSFITYFTRLWEMLVMTGNKCIPGLPVYHLQNDGFWQAYTKEGPLLERPIKSTKQFNLQLSHGVLDAALFSLLMVKENRDIMKMAVLDTYFQGQKTNAGTLMPNFFKEVEMEILEETTPKYRIKNTVIEGFVRDWKFQHLVKSAYEYTCCISGYKMEPTEMSIIEACHIRPHAQFGINSITNGIPLSAHLHNAFDKGIISIDTDYKVIIKNKRDFTESQSPFNIRQFQDKKILLPELERYYPSQDHLAWHRKVFEF